MLSGASSRYRRALELLIAGRTDPELDELAQGNSVFLLGELADPGSAYRRMTLYVHSSLSEGLPARNRARWNLPAAALPRPPGSGAIHQDPPQGFGGDRQEGAAIPPVAVPIPAKMKENLIDKRVGRKRWP